MKSSWQQASEGAAPERRRGLDVAACLVVLLASSCGVSDRIVQVTHGDTDGGLGASGASPGAGGQGPGAGGHGQGSSAGGHTNGAGGEPGGTGGTGSGGEGPASGGTAGSLGAGGFVGTAGSLGAGGLVLGGGGKLGAGGTPPGAGGTIGTAGSRSSGGSVGAGGSGTVSPALTQAILNYAQEDCAKIAACAAGDLAFAFGTTQECVDRTMLANLTIVSLPGTTYDVAHFTACQVAEAQASCAAFLSPTPLAACKRVGSLAAGAACNIDDQCASSYCKSTGYACGVCAAAPLPGASCTGDWNCASTNVCASGKCAALGALGASCSATAPCFSLFDCVNGKCVAQSTMAGAACDATNGTGCNFLQSELFCGSGTCVQLSPSPTSCAGLTFCEKLGTCSGTSCIPGPADDGGACDTQNLCEWPAVCVNGACQLPGVGAGTLCNY